MSNWRAVWLVLALGCRAGAAGATAAGKDDQPAPKQVAITIDDGPRPAFIPRALDIFDKYGVKVTFFNIGQNVHEYPQLTAECARRGHEVENHSWSHPQLPRCSAERIRSELNRTSAAILAQTGREPIYLRPPYGATSRGVRSVISALGMEQALWSIDPFDWQGSATPQRTSSRILSHLHNQAVILIHEAPATLAALPAILSGIKARGYELVTYDELMTGKPWPGGERDVIVIHCGVGSDDEAVLAKGCAYALERGLRVASPPAWNGRDELRFKLVMPAGTRGTLRLDLVGDGESAEAAQAVYVNELFVGSFRGTATVRAPLESADTHSGEVAVRVAGVGGQAHVANVAFAAAR